MISNQGRILLSLGLSLAFWSCSAAPEFQMSAQDKKTDMEGMYSNFERYYAPLPYKASRSESFNFEKMKADYLQQAMNTPDNEAYYNVVHRFVAEFKDPHTSASFLAAAFRQAPRAGHSRVAYLGFMGMRKGEGLIVTNLLPSINAAASKFVIQRGDLITKIDGIPLKEYVLTKMVPYRDLGNESSNLTYHMNLVFNRFSLSLPIPTEEWATVTLERGDKPYEYRLPWIKKDLVAFIEQQQAAAGQSLKAASAGGEEDEDRVQRLTQGKYRFYDLASLLMNVDMSFWGDLKQQFLGSAGSYGFLKSFVFTDALQIWNSRALDRLVSKAAQVGRFGAVQAALTGDPLDRLERDRMIPPYASAVRKSRIYPALITNIMLRNKENPKQIQNHHIAYIYLDTFAPEVEDENEAVEEFKRTLLYIRAQGVRDIIIDLLDNGGGSLSLSAKLAQALTPKRIDLPKIQFMTSEGWLDTFRDLSVGSPSDSGQELARRVVVAINEAKKSNQRLTVPQELESFFPFQIQPSDKTPGDFRIVALINELCVSACDIFAGMLKDNQLATLIGSKTMGGGGNVILVPNLSPSSNMLLQQTHSLVVRSNGKYIENEGIEPDVPYDSSEDGTNPRDKYNPILSKAVVTLIQASLTEQQKEKAEQEKAEPTPPPQPPVP